MFKLIKESNKKIHVNKTVQSEIVPAAAAAGSWKISNIHHNLDCPQ